MCFKELCDLKSNLSTVFEQREHESLSQASRAYSTGFAELHALARTGSRGRSVKDLKLCTNFTCIHVYIYA